MKHDLIIDPEFERFVPPLTTKERELLEESVLKEGCRDAIIVWNNIILDGHNRYAICVKHGIDFQTKSILMESRDEAISWICINQMGRRNITEETRRYLIGKRYEAEKRIGARNITGRNQYSPPMDSPHLAGKAQLQMLKHGISGRIGAEYNMNHATIERYGRYAQAVDHIAEVEPAIVPHILSGSVSVAQENMIDLSKLTDRQIKAVTASIPRDNEYKLSRDRIIEVLRNERNQAPATQELPQTATQAPSVKDMPAYDPDSEVASLALTIPSWRTSMERVRLKAAMNEVSTTAKEHLWKELEALRRTIEAILCDIQEG